jgi:hypothetical protein
MRASIQASQRLGEGDLVAWDCLIVFGLLPAKMSKLSSSTAVAITPLGEALAASW